MSTITAQIDKKEVFIQTVKTSAEAIDLSALSDELRSSGLEGLERFDFPNRRTELWKYSPTGKIQNSSFRFEKAHQKINAAGFCIPDLDSHKLVFTNGQFRPEFSSVKAKDFTVNSLRAELEAENGIAHEHLGKSNRREQNVFTALNDAYAEDGLFLHLPKGIKADKPIEVLFLQLGENVLTQPRNLIVCEDDSHAEVIIQVRKQGSGSGLINGLTEGFLGKNTDLSINNLQFENTGFAVWQMDFTQKDESKLDVGTFAHNCAWIRNNLLVAIDGEHCLTNMHGVNSLSGKQHVDNHTRADHLKPNCESNELYKIILDDSSTGVFNGKVIVHKDAQKTNAFQSNKNIVLSDNASMNSKPELEIYADDVKCSHGSTTGQLDEDAIFYLMARGLSRSSAINLLVSAFLGEAIEQIESEPVRDFILKQFSLLDPQS